MVFVRYRRKGDVEWNEEYVHMKNGLGTVKTYIHRARHELRRALEHTRE